MSSHIIFMHINLVSKLYASNFYAYWAVQQAQSAHQPQAGYQLSSHEKLQAEQLTNPPGLHEDENQAAKKAKTANAGMEKFVEVTLQEAVKCMQGEMVKQNGEMLKLLMQHRSNPKPDLAVPADVGTFAEYKTLGGSYAVVSPTSSSSSSSSREGSRDEGLGKTKKWQHAICGRLQDLWTSPLSSFRNSSRPRTCLLSLWHVVVTLATQYSLNRRQLKDQRLKTSDPDLL